MSEEAIKPEEKVEVKDVAFPDLPNGKAVFYDDEKHRVWLGLDFDKINVPHFVSDVMDMAKWEFHMHLSSYHQEKIKQEMFKQSLAGKRANGVMKDLFEKGKKFVGIGGQSNA